MFEEITARVFKNAPVPRDGYMRIPLSGTRLFPHRECSGDSHRMAVNAYETSCTDSRLCFCGRRLLRALLRSLADASCAFGSLAPPAAYVGLIDSVPPVQWWRTSARSGIAAAEAFANGSTQSQDL